MLFPGIHFKHRDTGNFRIRIIGHGSPHHIPVPFMQKLRFGNRNLQRKSHQHFLAQICRAHIPVMRIYGHYKGRQFLACTEHEPGHTVIRRTDERHESKS